MERFEPGSRFRNLDILKEIGHGAFGRVYLARDTVLHRQVALKTILSGREESSEEYAEGLLNEARLISQLQSPHVVGLFHVHSLDDGGWAFEMEYVEGGTLEDIFDQAKIPPLPQTQAILRGVAEGLRAAHEAGIIHGDVKPGNVLLDRHGRAKLTDFGLARAFRDTEQTLAAGSDLGGTPRYMAPEVIMNDRLVPASDIWGFGLIAYQLLSGRHPFECATLNELFHAVLNSAPESMPDAASPRLAQLALRCLGKTPEDRPASCGELLKVLDEAEERGRAAARTVEPRVAAPTLQGRDPELRRLMERLELATQGRGSAVLVAGEAGIGKTTLMRALYGIARARSLDWIEARVTRVEGLLRPLVHAIRRQIRDVSLPDDVGSSRRMIEDLLNQDEVALDSHEQLIWASERLLKGLAAQRPLVLLIEDVQLGHLEAARLLEELAARLSDAGILLAVTLRVTEERGPVAEGRSIHDMLSVSEAFDRFELGPLAAESLVAILEQAHDGSRLAPVLARRVTHLADGNPLYAKELLRHLLETGQVAERDGYLTPTGSWEPRGIPKRIRDLVGQRFRGLPEQQRALLDVAAVDGVEFDGEAVAAVLELPLLDVLRQLQVLFRDRHLVVPREAGYRFSHPVIEEVIYRELARDYRTILHGRLAEHLEARAQEEAVDPERLGHHWEAGGDAARARPYLLEAGIAAERRQEQTRAVDLLTRAGLASTELDADTVREHAQHLFSLANSYADLGRLDEAEHVFTMVLKAAEATDNEDLRLRTVARSAPRLLFSKGVKAVDEDLLRRAAEELDPSRELGFARYAMGLLARNRADLDEARRWFTSADRVFRAIHHEPGHSGALDQLGTLARRSGDLRKAERLYARAARCSAHVGRRTNAAISEVNRALAAFGRGRLERLEDSLRQSIRTLELEGATPNASHAALILAEVLMARGETAGAEACVRESRERLESANYLPALASAFLLGAELSVIRGKYEEATSALAAAREFAEQSEDHQNLSVAAAVDVQRLFFSGALREAAARADALLESLRERSSAKERDEVVDRLSEAVLCGLPAEILSRQRMEGIECGETVALVLEASRDTHDTMAPVERMFEAADRLLAPEVGERRANKRVRGHWLRAVAHRAAGDMSAARGEIEQALEGARRIGHVYQTEWLGSMSASWLQ